MRVHFNVQTANDLVASILYTRWLLLVSQSPYRRCKKLRAHCVALVKFVGDKGGDEQANKYVLMLKISGGEVLLKNWNQLFIGLSFFWAELVKLQQVVKVHNVILTMAWYFCYN